MLPTLEETQNLYLNKDSSFRAVIKKKCSLNATNVGDEGGFAPNIQENKGLQLIRTTIAKADYTSKVPSPLFFSFMCLVHSMFYKHLVFLLSSPVERVKQACFFLLLKLSLE
ncbi:enolase-like isoform X4 [Olea europaea var. sylvestris]|uniref:enolase-like isoform X4 n=1 Tax=Olea europaea var. sylvestris TaxID=158386 RepID=UPI000C1D1159|nr:enolase-like isoform X4 [Olea europaea var. sylvestris]